MEQIFLDGSSLTCEQVVKLAFSDPQEFEVVLTDEAKQKVSDSADAVQELLDKGEVAYGITTGFGAFKNKLISREDVERLQENILKSHAVGVGDPFDIPTTRAIMVIRANTLSSGYSGIRLSTIELLLEFLNKHIHPVIPQKGSLGASGDLAPLAHMALPLIGMGEVNFEGDISEADAILHSQDIKPIRLAAKEGLALTNGTTVMTAIGLLQTYRAKRLSEIADIAGCLSLEALNGTVSAYDKRIHALRPHPRQIECAERLLDILEGSEFTRGHDPSNVQDAYTLRCIPQVHGACRDTIDYVEWVVGIELNAVTDNPLIFRDPETGKIDVLSGGNFHGEPLAIAMDCLAISLTELGNISERRIMRLTDEDSNAHVLPAFLTENGGLNSGFMIVQYTAASLATENKVLAHPASVDTIPSSMNVEDHVSMGATSAIKLIQITDNLEEIISLELFSAAQAVDFRKRKIGDKKLGRRTAPVYQKIREVVPFIEEDTVMYPHMRNVKKLVRNGLI